MDETTAGIPTYFDKAFALITEQAKKERERDIIATLRRPYLEKWAANKLTKEEFIVWDVLDQKKRRQDDEFSGFMYENLAIGVSVRDALRAVYDLARVMEMQDREAARSIVQETNQTEAYPRPSQS